LLNTRRISEPASDAFPEVQKSVYHYGLPDITSLSSDSVMTRQRLRRQVEDAIALFEPRLTDVRVSVAESEDAERRQLRFIVEAMLRMDPNPERVLFDTVLDPTRGEFQVIGESDEG
jgi:type VI secretion system protein ImpF